MSVIYQEDLIQMEPTGSTESQDYNEDIKGKPSPVWAVILFWLFTLMGGHPKWDGNWFAAQPRWARKVQGHYAGVILAIQAIRDCVKGWLSFTAQISPGWVTALLMWVEMPGWAYVLTILAVYVCWGHLKVAGQFIGHHKRDLTNLCIFLTVCAVLLYFGATCDGADWVKLQHMCFEQQAPRASYVGALQVYLN